jgi:hypothetical protein
MSKGFVTGERGAVSGFSSALNLSIRGCEATRRTVLQPADRVDVHVGPFQHLVHVIPDEGVAGSDATGPMKTSCFTPGSTDSLVLETSHITPVLSPGFPRRR